jgi:hypothetical protein
MYEGEKPMEGNCDLIGGQCYYDGSTLAAQEYLEILIREGHEGLWKALEQKYEDTFGAAV